MKCYLLLFYIVNMITACSSPANKVKAAEPASVGKGVSITVSIEAEVVKQKEREVNLSKNQQVKSEKLDKMGVEAEVKQRPQLPQQGEIINNIGIAEDLVIIAPPSVDSLYLTFQRLVQDVQDSTKTGTHIIITLAGDTILV